MIIPRVYTVSFSGSAQAGAVDWFELIAGSTTAIILLKLFVNQTTEVGDAQEEEIGYYIKRASGAYTSGSGGATGVARPSVRAGDGLATFTAETNNTTKLAVGTGTLTTMHEDAFNVRSGLQLIWTPETAISTSPSQALVIGMDAAPADSVTWKGTAYVGELVP